MEKNREPVTQQDLLGCSIACVAFICNTKYENAKKYFSNLGDANKTGFYCKHIVSALEKAGKQYNYKYLKQKIQFKDDSIVFIKRSKRFPFGHFLVRWNEGWMDPWINFKKNSADLQNARSGFRKRLPGKAIYLIFPDKSLY